MTLEDRERNFEKALGRELKANGASGLDCPDAETLAAYHDRMLSPEEMAAQKTHIAACPRCQEILATLEVTEAIPSGAEDSEKVPVKAADLAGSRAKKASVREMPKRKAFVRWAVPAGAIAAGLLVWIAINSSRSAMMTKQTVPVTVAENREQKGSPPTAQRLEEKAPAASTQMSDRLAENERIATKQESDAYAFGSGDRGKTLSKAQEETMSRGRAAAAPPYSHGPRQLQNNAQNQTQNQMLYQTQNGQITTQNQATEFDKLSDLQSAGKNAAALEQNTPRRNEQARKAAPAASPPAPAPVSGVGAGAAGGKPVDADKRKDANDKDTEIQAATQMVEVTGADASVSTDEKGDKETIATQKKMKVIGGLAAASLRDTGAGGLGLVQTPDAKVLWFFTANGTVFRSEDGGKTTRAQKIGEGMKFLAGSAPDAKTCWLLAEKGIVLRTKDGGKKWVTITAPADGNFTVITGLDAMSALITDASGRVSYSTTDGGATWKVVAQK